MYKQKGKNKMDDLQLMYDVMQSSLDKDHNHDFASDVSDVSKVLDMKMMY